MEQRHRVERRPEEQDLAVELDEPRVGRAGAVLLVVLPTADVSVTKSLAPDPPAAGNTVVYTVTALNGGPSPATNVVVTDQLPALATFISCGPSPCSVVASVRASTRDPNGDNDTTELVALVTPGADLDLTKFASPPTAGPEDLVTFTLTLTNRGPGAASDVIVSDALPVGLSFVSSPDGCVATGQTVACPVGDLAAGETVTIRVDAGVASTAQASSIANSASVTSATPDPVPESNEGIATLGLGLPGVNGQQPGGAPACDPLLAQCVPQSPSPGPPPGAPPTSSGDGAAVGQPRMPDLRGTVRATWDGETLHVELRVCAARPKLVRRAVDVRLTIAGVLSRQARIGLRGRGCATKEIGVAAGAMSGDPAGKRLVARLDPNGRILETREQNNVATIRIG